MPETPAWGSDPELLATFREEMQERLSSLSAGLLQLEGSPRSRSLVQGLFRDAHTVKGSARLLGLDDVVRLAHRMEDLLGAVRDGRIGVRRDLVDVLLAATEALGRGVPGGDHALAAGDTDALAAALDAALTGRAVLPPAAAATTPAAAAATPAAAATTPAAPPLPSPAPPVEVRVVGHEPPAPDRSPSRAPSAPALRVGAGKVHDLLDAVQEVELGARRIEHAVGRGGGVDAACRRATAAVQAVLDAGGAGLPDPAGAAAAALLRLRTAGAELAAEAAALRLLAEDHRERVVGVRERAMGLAMVPVHQLTGGYPALVRRLARAAASEVDLVLTGGDVEVDKRVLDAVSEALSHLVTNAVDHGCEPARERIAAGKPAAAQVTVAARTGGGTVTVSVSDDGRGVDETRVREVAVRRGLLAEGAGPAELLDVLATPSFSTREVVTETSGRGVGLDAVRSAVEQVGGSVAMTSRPGAGTTVEVTLPVSLGVLHCLLVRAGGESYAVPVSALVETLSLQDLPTHEVAGVPVVVRDGAVLPLLDLAAAVGAPATTTRNGLLARWGDRSVVWAVEELEGEAQVVVKDLGGFLSGTGVPGVTGATVDETGRVVCLLDLREISAWAVRPRPAAAPLPVPSAARVLVAEDSVGVRELERAVLTAAGYDVTTCVDGREARRHLAGPPYDLVLSDVEMPGLDGFGLTREVRRAAGWENVPVVLMTSRGSESDQREGLAAGASAYLLKSEFDAAALVATVERLIGR